MVFEKKNEFEIYFNVSSVFSSNGGTVPRRLYRVNVRHLCQIITLSAKGYYHNYEDKFDFLIIKSMMGIIVDAAYWEQRRKKEKMKITCKNILCMLTTGLLLYLFEGSIYNFIFPEKWGKFWIIIPLLFFVICYFLKRLAKFMKENAYIIESSNLVALVILFINVCSEKFSSWFSANFQLISFVLVIIGIAGFIVLKTEKMIKPDSKTGRNNKLFNLFYLNTSKAHEIAMLIDNKIIKNIESEQVSSYTSKTNYTFSLGKKENLLSENGVSMEESSKQRVFESFDVKQTKSIMLRKIYDEISKTENCNFSEGNLVLLENIQLQQLNVDDTVMILDVLQDSKFKNQKNDDIEINLNKMMDKMLDDFTIDYSFVYKAKDNTDYNCIIRLPYKSMSNFENGYQHNDLQLGRLSIIGIYRGKINFSLKESISSKFLDLLSKSYYQQQKSELDTVGMRLSYNSAESSQVDFDFDHKKLTGEKHLIDVIAIIQEINLEIDKS